MKFNKIILFFFALFDILIVNSYKIKTIVTINNYSGMKTNNIVRLKKMYKNDDVIGVLKIQNTDSTYVVTQSKDNSFYLKKDAFKNEYKGGNPFLDYRINIDSKKLLIYGHNSKYSNMPFNILMKYYDKDFFENHKNLIFETNNEINTYEIFSVYTALNDFNYLNILFNDAEWLVHLKDLKSKSIYNSNTTFKATDKILILQTCSTKKEFEKYKKKFLVIAAVRKEKDEKNI